MDLGECLYYTDEDCPNCARMRVERWSCGKRVCEKCHWIIEDGTYYVEGDIIDKFVEAGEMYLISPEEQRILFPVEESEG